WFGPSSAPDEPTFGNSQSRPSVNLRVSPGPEDVVWTCGPSPGSAAMRWMAEVKRSYGFHVASVCLGIDQAATIDQLDAADMIVCGSSALREQLNDVAIASGRPSPNVRVHSIETGPVNISGVDELVGSVCEDILELRSMAV